MAFEGIADRAAAEELRGAPIELAGADVPPPEEGAFFRFDLVGCEVFQGAVRLGAVAAVEDGVAHDVLLLDSGLRCRSSRPSCRSSTSRPAGSRSTPSWCSR